jgi:hypothetical protein
MRIYLPLNHSTRLGFFSSTGFRAHYPQIAEMLEELYDRSAENCDLFVNISEVNKYSVTCTVCRNFDGTGCGSADFKGPNIINLLQTACKHDSLH